MLLPLIGGSIKWCFCLTSVCLKSVAYIGPKLRTEAYEDYNWDRGSPRHTWPGHHFQGQRSRSPDRFTHRGLNVSGSCSGERGNVLGVGNYCYVAVCLAVVAAAHLAFLFGHWLLDSPFAAVHEFGLYKQHYYYYYNYPTAVSPSYPYRDTLRHSVLTAIFPGEPGLAGCPLNSPSPFIPGLCILLGQT